MFRFCQVTEPEPRRFPVDDLGEGFAGGPPGSRPKTDCVQVGEPALSQNWLDPASRYILLLAWAAGVNRPRHEGPRREGESAMAEFEQQLREWWSKLTAWLRGGQRADAARKAKAALEDLRASDAARKAEAALRDLREGQVGRKAEAALRDLREGETGRKAREALRDLRDSDAVGKARGALRDLRDGDAGRKAKAAIRDLRDSPETHDKS